VLYLKGPQQGISSEKRIAMYAMCIVRFCRWLRESKESDSEGTTLPVRMVEPHAAAQYATTKFKTKAAEETFATTHSLICQWITTSDTTRFLENANITKLAQQRQRQKRQARARKGKDKSPIPLTRMGIDGFRLGNMIDLSNHFDSVVERRLQRTTTTADRVFMSYIVPITICIDGKPVRVCDQASLTTSQGTEMMRGNALVIEEQKQSCQHNFAFIPHTPNIQKVMTAYIELFRPCLADVSTRASENDVRHAVKTLPTVSLDMIAEAEALKKRPGQRLPSKLEFIAKNNAPPGGWSKPDLNGTDLKTGYNASKFNSRLFLDHNGNPNNDIGKR